MYVCSVCTCKRQQSKDATLLMVVKVVHWINMTTLEACSVLCGTCMTHTRKVAVGEYTKHFKDSIS